MPKHFRRLDVGPPALAGEGDARPVSTPKADLLQGTLDLLILKALSLGPLHGYGVIQRIRQMSGEMLFVEQGALYPALYRIEQKEWVSSKWGVNETGSPSQVLPADDGGPQTALC